MRHLEGTKSCELVRVSSVPTGNKCHHLGVKWLLVHRFEKSLGYVSSTAQVAELVTRLPFASILPESVSTSK